MFVHDAGQRRLAEETARAIEARSGRPVTTAILPFTGFTLAEDYHQKYRMRRLELVEREMEAHYPELPDLVRSTAATRINAFAGGYGTAAELETLAAGLGLSDEALDELWGVVR